MEYRRFGNMYMLRIDRGEEILEALKAFLDKSGVRLGAVSGIGAVNRAVLGLFDNASKKFIAHEYNGDYEVASLSGNITTMDGETYIHIHACLADIDNRAYGGHLKSAVVSATCEIIITAIDGEIDRELDGEVGLNLLKF